MQMSTFIKMKRGVGEEGSHTLLTDKKVKKICLEYEDISLHRLCI